MQLGETCLSGIVAPYHTARSFHSSKQDKMSTHQSIANFLLTYCSEILLTQQLVIHQQNYS